MRGRPTYTYEGAKGFMARARNPSNGRPLCNNTRMYERLDGFAIQLHSTDVVTILPGDRYVLRTGGWQTITTSDRIMSYAPIHYGSRWTDGKGIEATWMVQGAETARDPEPPNPEREIPRPFHADNPGPEPVKSREGCVAGQRQTLGEMNEMNLLFPGDHEPGDQFIGLKSWDQKKVDEQPSRARSVLKWIDTIEGGDYRVRRWGVRVWDWREEAWGNYATRPRTEQCPHCAAFDKLHADWSRKMNGGWGLRRGGYALWREMMDEYGDRAAWHQAYITEWRAVRALKKLWREWRLRNSAPMDGVTVNAEGYALRRCVDAAQKDRNAERRRIRRADRAREAAERKERAVRRFKDKALEAWEENLPFDQRVRRIVRDIHLISVNGKAV